MAKIYFLAFVALLIFVAVSAQEEQDKEPVLNEQLGDPKEYFSPCTAGENRICNQYCKNKGKRFGACNSHGICVCI
ncbi:drosomycin-like [Vespula squamosa]|uniref:Drosomycin-like n=1 Tax=Vespula squamosa TaxID=30214 RepID=A0ABD2APC0_VESSQ